VPTAARACSDSAIVRHGAPRMVLCRSRERSIPRFESYTARDNPLRVVGSISPKSQAAVLAGAGARLWNPESFGLVVAYF
jgi:hypothetical protein